MTLSPLDQARAHQTAAADPGRSVFVTANAGSGKTTTLVDRVARLLLRKAPPGEILCVTYTKAAAAEMQARLFEKLGRWAVMDDAELSGDLVRLDGRDPAGLKPADLREARRLFARALETPGGLKIQTIHAFCEKLLRRFPIEAGVSPAFKVLENEAAVALSHAAREDLARAALADPDGRLGEAYAHFAVELDWKAFHALLAMIEAERGKLVAYVERVDSGAAPGPHVLVGADPDVSPAAVERDFLDWIDGAEWMRMAEAMQTGSTNDQKLAACMRAAAPPGSSVAGMADVFLKKDGDPRTTMGTKSAPPAAVAWLAELQLKYLAIRDVLRAARVADDTVKALTLAQAHAAFYESAKLRQGALDFSDLVVRTVDLLTRRSTAAWVLFKLDGGIEHVLIDEAQDTAPDQWAIFKALTEEFFSGEGAERRGDGPRIPRTVFAVGDEKQSIYSFQGARPERLRQEAQAYEALVRGAGRAFEAVPLDTSFRSTEEVLAFVDAAFVGPERTRALVGVSGDIPTHHPARVDQHGAIDLWPLFHDPAAPDREAWNAPVDKEDARSGRKQLAQALARDIRKQVEAGTAVHDHKTDEGVRPARWGDFLILVRRRDALFEEIIRALKAEAVPVAGADRLKLSSHIVFDDLIAVARFVLYPDDDLSLAEVLRSPFCDVSDFGDPHSLYPLADKEGRAGRTLWRELQHRAGEQPAWRRARDFVQAALDARDRDPFAFFSSLLNRVDDTGLSGRARILARLGREAEEAIDETLAQVLAAEGRGGVDLETCVSLLEAADVEVKREMEGARNEVRVMTVHGAKGLEAPIVILPDTTSRAKPQGPTLMPAAGEDGAEGEGWLMCPGSAKDDCPASKAAREARVARTDAESLRLLYVALTRARDRLVIMGRALKRPEEGFEAGSWWSVIAETFQRLDEDDPLNIRDIGEGVLRFGVDPERLLAGTIGRARPATVPDWARTAPTADTAARFASPSKMEETTRIPAPSPLATTAGPGAPLGRFRRGDLIHRLLERLPDIAPGDRDAAARRILSRERDLDEDQSAEMAAAAFAVLDDARFAPVFGPGSRPEVALTGSVANVPVSGRMDRLVVTPDRVLVIDYKTNRPAPDRIEDADPAYVLQMAVYASVLARLYPDRTVEAALVWTDGPRLMAVPQAMMDAALAD
ncbi:MAG: double-strand break repair helicase AddA [Alphaproteobacteria bacterium]|jgi:ATP-dependent helicase/nuclease subunit A|nr:double-strand break repair helicase AddA [Alphaproteobacteria bacterium]MBU2041315.1 double-strand break repair helicase AddA [Alphaproteobacteria bacterium]MBU2125344.1 double-strand break repair helicase AddA [Alphaproteobacteria bacterium]MBU2208548.1 double-strand break repair helicase AddA [Alphaproteobacteria bacterium]MBU2291020.1 double-strand break repair helicase AddA [Alphaproteobacteria bacterium]